MLAHERLVGVLQLRPPRRVVDGLRLRQVGDDSRRPSASAGRRARRASVGYSGSQPAVDDEERLVQHVVHEQLAVDPHRAVPQDRYVRRSAGGTPRRVSCRASRSSRRRCRRPRHPTARRGSRPRCRCASQRSRMRAKVVELSVGPPLGLRPGGRQHDRSARRRRARRCRCRAARHRAGRRRHGAARAPGTASTDRRTPARRACRRSRCRRYGATASTTPRGTSRDTVRPRFSAAQRLVERGARLDDGVGGLRRIRRLGRAEELRQRGVHRWRCGEQRQGHQRSGDRQRQELDFRGSRSHRSCSSTGSTMTDAL